MKRLPIIALIALFFVSIAVCSCGDNDSSLENYTEWREANDAWYDSIASLPAYSLVKPVWYQGSGVYMRYHNNRALTAGNLRPLFSSTVKVKYKGELYNGVPFDSSYMETDSCRTFTINEGLITGWQIALTDMHVGDSADVIIPYLQGYGVSGTTSIPPYSALRFSIKLVDIPAYEVRP